LSEKTWLIACFADTKEKKAHDLKQLNL